MPEDSAFGPWLIVSCTLAEYTSLPSRLSASKEVFILVAHRLAYSALELLILELELSKMILPDLPPEILGQILHFKDVSFKFIALWQCGSRQLNSKLATGVTYVHLETLMARYSYFPSLISELRGLRYLYVKSGVEDVKKWKETIRGLPSTLEALHLVSDQTYEAFLPSSDEYVDTDYGRGPTHFINMDTLFPRLHTLEFDLDDEDCAFAYGSLKFLSALPSSLTRLIGSDLCIDADDPCDLATMLPKTLKRLEMEIRIHRDMDGTFLKNWATALPDLEYIKRMSINGEPPKDMSWLPRSFLEGDFDGYLSSLEPSLSPFFPPRLAHLHLNHVDFEAYYTLGKQWTSDLPKNLKSVEFSLGDLEGASAERGQLILQQLPYLPRSLERLQVRAMTSLDWESTETKTSAELFWPPNLTLLDLSQVGCGTERFKLFPKTLKELKVSLESSGTIDANDLSPTLTKLLISGSWADGELSFQNELPKSLKSLSVTTYSSDSGIAENVLHKVSNLTALTHLGISLAAYPSTFAPLPASLVDFKASKWHANLISALPRSLTNFHAASLDFAEASVNCFNRLPTELKSFKIMEVAPGFSQQNLVFAIDGAHPLHQLRIFHVPQEVVFSSSLLRCFPNAMRSLRMKLNAIHVNDAPFLPSAPILCDIATTETVEAEVAEFWPLGLNAKVPAEIQERVRERNDERRKAHIRGLVPEEED